VFVGCCDDGPVAFQDFAVNFKKWCRAKFVCFVGDQVCRRRFREKLRMKQPHRSVKTAVAIGFGGALINRHRDGLEMLVAPASLLPLTGGLRLAPYEGWRVGIVLEVLHQLRPPSALPFGRGSLAFSRLRSAQRPSILSSIRCSRLQPKWRVSPPAGATGFPFAAKRPVSACVQFPNEDDPAPSLQLTVRCHENKMRTTCQRLRGFAAIAIGSCPGTPPNPFLSATRNGTDH
jgi:hypothetical protein